MSVMDYEIGNVSTDTAPSEGALTCKVCGNSFDHTGRGRKPTKCENCRTTTPRTTHASRGNKDVETALAVLDGTYSTVALGLFMFNPDASKVWADQLDTLQKQNRVTLSGDANLTKAICRLGERTGKAAFFLSHVFAVIPVAVAIKDGLPKRERTPKEDDLNPSGVTEIHEPANLRFFGG